ncbi:class I SAM-dependent methyltransferase [Tropicibacter oceani]|uniref:Class I SAM-dependent methyltransferase n=1 Tax=Tropicibacter oceani TaxID=3058420 RepID=A0ABY8QLY7_9RHOB|nr:class I SAM-dependent methyltransferase [Tropicibacter oceani]WGW04953.1 class I SAM-dependent methyltransferase [Tropicibacter oceani]
MTDPVTIEVYNRRAEEYAQVTASDGPDATLAAFIEGLPKGARVLDLGCGPGAAAAHMARAGLSVEAWDASASMVALAAAQPGVDARQASFDDLAKAEADSFDAIWANFSLLHAPRAAMPRHLAQIARILRPGGRFHIAVKEGQGSKRDRLGRLYAFYTQEDLTGLLKDAGLSPGPFQTGRDRGLDGALSPWISVTAYG